MKRLLFFVLVTAFLGDRAVAQPGNDFGLLTTPKTPSPGLPAGIEPVQPAHPIQPAPAVNPYPLPPNAGNWLVCAATYLGPEGADLARQICVDLRTTHRLQAYIFNRGEEERRKQDQEWEERKKAHPDVPMRRLRVRIPDQYAVLVGSFPDFEKASAYLPKIRVLPVPKLQLPGGKNPYEVMTYQDPEKASAMRQALVNPYHTAMVVRNPTATGSGTGRPKWDPFWKTLNEDEDRSLLKNPKAWSLVVKEYMGGRAIQDRNAKSGFLSAIGLGGKNNGESLDAAAAQARELARFLGERRFGFKTWVLHTRYSSVVCVGGFNGPDDPELHRVREQVRQLQFNTKNGAADPIGLLANPVPVEVPRF